MATKENQVAKAQTGPRIEKQATSHNHVFLIDWNDDGLLREIAVVCENPSDGTIYGVDIENLHRIDKARLKKVLVSQHADKYPLWELLDQARISNGTNFLDYLHRNAVKIKRPRGAVIGGGLSSVQTYGDDRQIGSEFSDPMSATYANEHPVNQARPGV